MQIKSSASGIFSKLLRRSHRRIPIIIALISTYFIFNLGSFKKENSVIQWDIISYYAYLPATFIYKDLSFEFKDNYQGEHQFVFWLEEGNLIKTTMGMSVLYAPFFFVAHLVANFTDYDSGGFSTPYRLALLLNCIFFLWLGLHYLRKLLLNYFSELTSTITILLLTFSTGLFYYATAIAPMPHAYNFSLFVLFIYFTIAWHDHGKMKDAIKLGLLFGLITLVRPGNALICLIFFFYGVYSKESFINRLLHFKTHFVQFLVLIACTIAVWIPQIAYWKWLSGDFIATFYTGESLIFGKGNYLKGMFSYRNGWLIYSPIMLAAIRGIALLRNQLKQFFLPVLLFTIVNTYVVLSWWCWWYTGFGNRAMIETGAVLAIPLAAAIEYLILTKKRLVKIGGAAIILILGLRGIQHSAQYHFGGLHFNAMTKEAYWHNIFEIKGDSTFWSLLREPDYENAKLGIDSYMDELNQSFEVSLDSSTFSDQDISGLLPLLKSHEVYNTEIYEISSNYPLQKEDLVFHSLDENEIHFPLKQKSANTIEFRITANFHHNRIHLYLTNYKRRSNLYIKRIGTRWGMDK